MTDYFDDFDDDFEFDDEEEELLPADPRILTALTNALLDSNTDVVLAAVNALVNIRDRAALPALSTQLNHPHEDIKIAVIQSIGAFKAEQSISDLMPYLKSENSKLRAQALTTISKLLGAEVSASTSQLGGAAALSFSLVPIENLDSEIEDKILSLLLDSDNTVALMAVRLVARLGISSAIQSLIHILQRPKRPSLPGSSSPFSRNPNDLSKAIRLSAMLALGNIADPEAVPVLTQFLKEGDTDERTVATRALSQINDSSTSAVLGQAFEENPVEIRRVIVKQFQNTITPEALLTLLNALQDVDEIVRKSANDSLQIVAEKLPLNILHDMLETNFREPVLLKLIELLGQRGDGDSIVVLGNSRRYQSEMLRSQAADALGAFCDERAVTTLIRFLDDPSQNVCLAAVRSLRGLGSPSSLPRRFGDTSPSLVSSSGRIKSKHRIALEQFTQLRPSIIDGLLHALKHSDDQVRYASLQAVLSIEDLESLPKLKAIMDDKTHPGRIESAVAVSKLGGEISTELLLEALQPDKNTGLAEDAVIILGDSENIEVVPAILDYLDRLLKVPNAIYDRFFDSAPFSAIAALGKIKDSRALHPLLEIARSADNDLRAAAVKALAELGDTSAFPTLRELNTIDDEDLNLAVIQAAQKLGTPDALPLIRESLHHSNEKVQIEAVKLVGSSGDQEAVPILWSIFNDADKDLEKVITESLAAMKGIDLIPDYSPLLDNPDGKLRMKSARGLAAIKHPLALQMLLQAICREADKDVRTEQLSASNELIENLGFSGSFEAFQKLSSDEIVRLNEILEITSQGTLSDSEIERISAVGEKEDVEERGFAVLTAGLAADPRTVPHLIGRLNDEDENIQRVAAWSLERIGTAEALEAVKQWRGSQKSG